MTTTGTDHFEAIVTRENVAGALDDVARRLSGMSKLQSFRGIDGKPLKEHLLRPDALISEVREQLLAHADVDPAVRFEIAKKYSNRPRQVYRHTVRSQVRATAIHRVLAPHADAQFSPFLFSHRSGRIPHDAARGVARRYGRHWQQDHVFRGDISNYGENFDTTLLLGRLESLGINGNALQALGCFLRGRALDQGKLVTRPGALQGTPLSALCSNAYLDDLDARLGVRIALYRRVGDDIFFCDKDEARVHALREELIAAVAQRNLTLHPDKTDHGPCRSTPFTYLGYRFSQGRVGLPEDKLHSITEAWSGRWRYREVPMGRRLRRLRREAQEIRLKYAQWVVSFRLVTDETVMKDLSRSLDLALVRYLFHTYSERHHRKTRELLSEVNIPPLFTYYAQLRHGRIKPNGLIRQAATGKRP